MLYVTLNMKLAVTGTQRPTYPSSKPKRVDWDKLEAQVKKEVFFLPEKKVAVL
jgi:hypothetical protein